MFYVVNIYQMKFKYYEETNNFLKATDHAFWCALKLSTTTPSKSNNTASGVFMDLLYTAKIGYYRKSNSFIIVN